MGGCAGCYSPKGLQGVCDSGVTESFFVFFFFGGGGGGSRPSGVIKDNYYSVEMVCYYSAR